MVYIFYVLNCNILFQCVALAVKKSTGLGRLNFLMMSVMNMSMLMKEISEALQLDNENNEKVISKQHIKVM